MALAMQPDSIFMELTSQVPIRALLQDAICNLQPANPSPELRPNKHKVGERRGWRSAHRPRREGIDYTEECLLHSKRNFKYS